MLQNYQIFTNERLYLSCSTQQVSPFEVVIDPTQTPQRDADNAITGASVIYFELTSQ